MKILLIADGRSAITKNWLACLAGKDIEIALLSSFPCEKPAEVQQMLILPIAFSTLAGGQVKLAGQEGRHSRFHKSVSSLRDVLQKLRYKLGPMTLRFYRERYLDFLHTVEPDLVHALRIPFEGMLASFTPAQYPLIISTWGNDLTLHAPSSKSTAKWTRRTLQRANALMADTSRDLKLAKEWGCDERLPTLTVPGNGGLDLDSFKQRRKLGKRERKQKKKLHKYTVINPRGFRPGSVHQDVFFAAIPSILKEMPDVRFLCPAMAEQVQAEKWVHALGIANQVSLLPYLAQSELWNLFQTSDIYLSLSSHDGTPNTFLEALACGCFPIVGDILSLREWIENGKNGFLVNPKDEKEVAQAVVRALQDEKMREEAQQINWKIVSERADRKIVQKRVKDFYYHLLLSTGMN